MLVGVCVNRVDSRTKGFGDLVNLGKQSFAMRKDYEHILIGLVPGHGIDKGVGNVHVVHVKVAT